MVKTSQDKTTNMCLMLTVCSGSLLIFQSMFPKVVAYRKDTTSKINEFTVEDRRTTKQNYRVQRDMGTDIGDRLDFIYPTAPPDYDRKSEELPALIVDYANMIRNNIILLDNSVETRTRKRGNIKVEKYNVPIDPPCSCEHNKTTVILGSHYFPPYINIAICNEKLCPDSYQCEESKYNWDCFNFNEPCNNLTAQIIPALDIVHSDIGFDTFHKFYLPRYQMGKCSNSCRMVMHIVLRKRINGKEISDFKVHDDLKRQWVAVNISVTTGCVCKANYLQRN